MSLKSPKKSDLGKHWMKPRRDQPKRMQPETLPGMHMMRQTGWCAWKRQTGQYEPFDLILLLILSNAVQNSMNAGDNSLVGGLIGLVLHALGG